MESYIYSKTCFECISWSRFRMSCHFHLLNHHVVKKSVECLINIFYEGCEDQGLEVWHFHHVFRNIYWTFNLYLVNIWRMLKKKCTSISRSRFKSLSFYLPNHHVVKKSFAHLIDIFYIRILDTYLTHWTFDWYSMKVQLQDKTPLQQ